MHTYTAAFPEEGNEKAAEGSYRAIWHVEDRTVTIPFLVDRYGHLAHPEPSTWTRLSARVRTVAATINAGFPEDDTAGANP